MYLPDRPTRPHATTILGVRRGDHVALAGDGQVTQGDMVLKHGARKIRALHDGLVIAGFAGAVADALTLFGKFELQLKSWDGNIRRAAVELAKEWRGDRYLRRLEAQLLVADPGSILILSGEGDVIEPDDGIAAIGSGAPYATAAAKALLLSTDLDARTIVERAMTVAADLCIFTNNQFTIEAVGGEPDSGSDTDLEPAAPDLVAALPLDKAMSATKPESRDDDDEDDNIDRKSKRTFDRDGNEEVG